ncbi:MAG: hypothetical protein AAGA20_22085, partial [Planctomycetota bacterium]
MRRSSTALGSLAAIAAAVALQGPVAAAQELGPPQETEEEVEDAGPRSEGRRPRAMGGIRQRPGSAERATPTESRRATAFGATVDDIYPFGYPPERKQRLYFTMTDADHGEWISFREAREALRFDAPRFRAFDVDNDGRMTFEEFSSFVLAEASAGRTVTEPITRPVEGPPPRRNAEQLRTAYDVDLDGAISGLELETLLGDYQTATIERIDAAGMLVRLDNDGSERLEIIELERLAAYLFSLAEREPGEPP